MLGGALASVPFLGTEFMPKLDEGSLLIETRRLPSTSLPQGMAIARDVERTLLQFPEVQSVVTNMGRPEMATETMGLYAGDVYVNFRPGRQPKARRDRGVHRTAGRRAEGHSRASTTTSPRRWRCGSTR